MLDGYIKIIKKEEKRVNGRPIFEDITLRRCYCKILDLYGAELYQALQVQLQDTIVFKVRYCKLMEEMRVNKSDYRVIYNNITYNIYQVDYSKYPKLYVLLKCSVKR